MIKDFKNKSNNEMLNPGRLPQTPEEAALLMDNVSDNLCKAISYINVCIQACQHDRKMLCDVGEVLGDAKKFLVHNLDHHDHIVNFFKHHLT